jgi:sterol desaturase/sphingolipid hydroxylase (fatty acid hydroxylase superfamily)
MVHITASLSYFWDKLHKTLLHLKPQFSDSFRDFKKRTEPLNVEDCAKFQM